VFVCCSTGVVHSRHATRYISKIGTTAPPHGFTVSVKLWAAAVPTPLFAVNASGVTPRGPAAEFRLSVAVPFRCPSNVTPLGSDLSPYCGVGSLSWVTSETPPCHYHVALLALVIAERSVRCLRQRETLTCRVPTPLFAVNVSK